jgi:hypothetical protein
MIAEVLAGGPTASFAPDGSWISENPIRFRAKAFNVDGWQASWSTFSIGDNDAPLVTAASTDGTSITLTFDEVVYIGAGTPQLAVNASLGATTADYTSGAGTATLVFTPARTIGVGETAFATYTQPGNGLESVIGDDVSTFTNYPITNGSEEAVTSFVGAVPNRSLMVDVAVSIPLAQYFLGVQETGGYSLETGTLPTGLSLNADTGAISGTPTVVETQAGISVTGTNDAQTATTNTFTLNVVSDDSKPRRVPRKFTWS